MPIGGEAALERLASHLGREAIIAAALDQLGDGGLSRCTLPALADRLGANPADLAEHFDSLEALFAGMAGAMADAGVDPLAEAESGSGWREVLRRRALNARQAMLSRRDGALLFAQLAAMPPIRGAAGDSVAALLEAGFSLYDARAAIQLIDRFALGWVVAEQAHPLIVEDEDEMPAFAEQLDSMLGGIGITRAWGGAAAKHRMFQSRLWIFLRNARDSANIAFSRADHIAELDRRILLLLQAQGELTLAAVSTANGVDKAQISRAIKRLSQVGLVQRSGIRSPLKLSAAGRHLAERLVRLAELRNRELTFGIADDQLVDLFGVLDTLLTRSMALYDQERKLTLSQDKSAEIDFPDHAGLDRAPGSGRIAIDRSRILPPFITLCSYMMRGGSLGYKRKTGLSNFDTWVLVEVSRDPPISWPQLVIALYRDQSQAGRTVNRLIEIGLVERSGKPGRRHGFFGPTAEGRRAMDIIDETGVRRSEFLFQGIPLDELDSFMTSFETLAHNAEVQVARERAIQEMDRD